MIRVRQATPADEPFVAGLVPRFVEHGAADGHTAEEVIAGTTRVLGAALRERSDDDVFLIALDANEKPLGFVYAVTQRDFFTGEPYLHVSEIATGTSGLGAGNALMQAAEHWAARRGYRFVTLNVVEENRPAQRFYERSGYAPGHRHLVKRI